MGNPELPNGIGSRRFLEDQGKKIFFTITDEIRRIASDSQDGAFYLQRIEYEEDKRIEIRFGYYIIGKKEGRKGKWVWGQYSPMLPIIDFKWLIEEAKKKGWLD
jgi:hypothetical protein